MIGLPFPCPLGIIIVAARAGQIELGGFASFSTMESRVEAVWLKGTFNLEDSHRNSCTVHKSKFNSQEIESIDLFYLGVLPLYIDVPSPSTVKDGSFRQQAAVR